MYDLSFRRNKADYILAITAMLQPVLTLLQLFLQDALHFDPEAANRVRVLSTAVPILISMIIVVRRNFKLTAFTYSIVLAILLYTTFMFPGRWAYMSSDVLKFTLPVVVPIGLCLASINNLPVLIRSMQYISVSAAIIGLMYAMLYLSGAFIIDSYSMTFSYALLFPTFVMISRKNIVWKGIALLLMIEMLAIGSRGALLVAIAYWCLTLVWGKLSFGRIVLYTIILLVGFYFRFDSLINILANLFDAIGINSRTLRLLISDELISHDSGRDAVAEMTWRLIAQNPLFGSGVWADRQYMDMYCHNVFLELLLDYGYIGAGIILLVFTVKQYGIFKNLTFNHKSIYLMMIAVLCPLIASSSYLTSFNVGMFLGFSYLIGHLNKQGLYQDYVFE